MKRGYPASSLICGFSNFVGRQLITSDAAAVLSAIEERCVAPGEVFQQAQKLSEPTFF